MNKQTLWTNKQHQWKMRKTEAMKEATQWKKSEKTEAKTNITKTCTNAITNTPLRASLYSLLRNLSFLRCSLSNWSIWFSRRRIRTNPLSTTRLSSPYRTICSPYSVSTLRMHLPELSILHIQSLLSVRTLPHSLLSVFSLYSPYALSLSLLRRLFI